MGQLIDRVHSELTDEEIDRIAEVYHQWRNAEGKYQDKAGWWKSATLDEIKSHGYVLTPGRYVGAEEVEDDGIPFEEKMTELSSRLYEQMKQSRQLETTIKRNLEWLGFGDKTCH